MKVLNFGSLNLDYIYQVPHFLGPGETLAAVSVSIVPGGKGLNQSVALARAGAEVWHAGVVGAGSGMLTELLEGQGVHLQWLRHSDVIQGNAVIQVTPAGENAILLCPGSNREITPQQVRNTIAHFEKGDWLVLQNEVSCLKEMIASAKERGMRIALNPSPYEERLEALDWDAISWLFINEVEGRQMTGLAQPEDILRVLRSRYPRMQIVLTLGKQGAICDTPQQRVHQPIFPVQAVDTTAAGDTFTGYFLASVLRGEPLAQCMMRAAAASAISVSRRGASVSIPQAQEVDAMLSDMSGL